MSWSVRINFSIVRARGLISGARHMHEGKQRAGTGDDLAVIKMSLSKPLHCPGNGGKLRLLLLFRGTPSVVFSSVIHLGACGDCAFLGLSPNVLTPELWGEALIWVLRSPPGEAACHTLEFEHPWTTDSNNGCPSRFTEALPKIHLREMAFGLSCAVNRCKI